MDPVTIVLVVVGAFVLGGIAGGAVVAGQAENRAAGETEFRLNLLEQALDRFARKADEKGEGVEARIASAITAAANAGSAAANAQTAMLDAIKVARESILSRALSANDALAAAINHATGLRFAAEAQDRENLRRRTGEKLDGMNDRLTVLESAAQGNGKGGGNGRRKAAG
jgi:poly-gamma-glutamate capsule biosynthesis protein CapA/YwtB (metallophosphatase superfamily)